MKVDQQCFLCCAKKAMSLLEQYQVPQEKAVRLMKEIYGGFSRADEEVSAPILMADMMGILDANVGISDAYEGPKRQYNQELLRRSHDIKGEIDGSKEPFMTGLRYALTGNYIDFGAMDTVSEEKLDELLGKCQEITVDEVDARRLKEDIARAKRLVYVTDNAGEIVLDSLWLQIIKEQNQQLDITVLVRGGAILNDAAEEDAAFVNLDKSFQVISNGTKIPGTSMEEISSQAREALLQADVCIAKGQGNFESLHGCGLNVYYLFLCKCDLFVKKFQVPRFSPVIVHEKRIVQYT